MSEPVLTATRTAGRVGRALIAGLLALPLAACVTVPADFRQPGITVVGVQPHSLGSMTLEFDILLRVTNPNRTALEIAGLSYEVRLAGSRVIDGVANDLPRIEAYGEAEVMLRAHADLIGSLGVLSRLMDNPGSPVEYQFNAEIDIGALYPTVKVEKAGYFKLN